MATKDTPIGEHTLASAGNNAEFSDQDDYDDVDVDVDGVFDAILWSDTPDDDYLKQLMMIEDGSKNKNKNKQDEKENASNNRADCDDDDDAEPPQNLGRTSSLERIFGYNKKGGRSNSRSNSKRIVAENGRDGSESSHSNQRKSRNKNEKHDDDDDDDDHRTVDELIEASEREEEMELNIILESGVSSSSRSLDAIPNPLPAAKTSTKNIRSHPTSVASEPITHALAQNQEQQHHQKQVLRETETTPLASPPNLHSTSTAGTGTMIWNDDHDSLAGDETVGNIVARMMLEDDEDGDGNTVSDSGLDTTNNECTSSFGSNGMIDTNGMMMAHGRGSGSGSGSRHVHDYDNNEGAVAGTQPQFVTDETSVGSIRDEIELIIARHQRDVVGEQQHGEQQQHHEEDATLGGHQTLVSTLSADYDDPHCARVRAMLGGAPRHPNTPSEGGECREEAIIDKNKHRRGSRYTWWGQGKTKRRPQQLRQQQQQAPKTPSRSVDDTPSPQNSVMKTKDPPGTPSTVLITRHPLGLATPPPSDRDPYEDSNIDSSFSESDEDAHQYGDYDDDDDDDDENTKQDPRHWGPYACFATGERHIRFYKWIMFGIALLLVLFVALVIALVFELGRRSPGHSPPPTTEPSLAKEDSPIIPEPIGDWVSNSNSNPALPAEEDEQNNLAVPETTLAPTVLLPDKALDVEDRLREIVGARLPDRLVHFDDFKSPQYRALEWMKSAHPGLAEIDEGDRWKLVQKYVLAVFYYATNGMEWETNTGWLTAGTNECDWFSTSSSGDLSVCDDAGKFAEIDLRLNNLQGTIPSELVLIADQLISITVNGNSLSGTIPSILVSELTNLIRFHVHWNFLSGSIPSEVGEMSSLTSLRLAKNKLVGSIPWQLSHLSNLKTLDAMSNGLSGGIPFLLGDLTALTSLNLSNNNISGDIPVEISNLIGLSTLILDRTDLEGTMPDEVCSKLTALETAEVDCEKVACWCCEGCK